jgi:hypothetical protein
MPRLGLTPENRAKRGPLPESVIREIERANDISIRDVLTNVLGTYIPEFTHKSWKAYCPFGDLHRDGGASQALRVYPDSNTAFCFAGCGFMNSVKLIQRHTGLKTIKAARHLLRLYGLSEPATFEERFQAALSPRARAASYTATLAAALHESLLANPLYEDLSLHPAVLEAIESQLQLLDDLDPDGTGASDWLHAASAHCRSALASATRAGYQPIPTDHSVPPP